MIIVNYFLEFREHVAMVRAINGVLRRVRVMKALAWLTGLAFLVTLPMSTVSVTLKSYLVLVPLVILPIVYFLPVYMTRLMRRGSPQWNGEQRLVFADNGIDGSNGNATSFISWEAIIRVAETRRFLLLFTSPQFAIGIPKRALAGPAEVTALVDYVRARAGRKGVAPPAPLLITGEPLVAAEFGWSTWEAFLAFWAISRLGIRVWPYAAFAAAVGLFTIGESVLFQHLQGRTVSVSVSLVALSFSPLAIILLIYPVVSLLYAILLSRRTPSIGVTQRIVVTDDGIRVRGQITATAVRWAMLTRVVETRRFFLFFLSKIQAFYLPKRAVQPEEIDVLRRTLRQHTEGRARELLRT